MSLSWWSSADIFSVEIVANKRFKKGRIGSFKSQKCQKIRLFPTFGHKGFIIETRFVACSNCWHLSEPQETGESLFIKNPQNWKQSDPPSRVFRMPHRRNIRRGTKTAFTAWKFSLDWLYSFHNWPACVMSRRIIDWDFETAFSWFAEIGGLQKGRSTP